MKKRQGLVDFKKLDSLMWIMDPQIREGQMPQKFVT